MKLRRKKTWMKVRTIWFLPQPGFQCQKDNHLHGSLVSMETWWRKKKKTQRAFIHPSDVVLTLPLLFVLSLICLIRSVAFYLVSLFSNFLLFPFSFFFHLSFSLIIEFSKLCLLVFIIISSTDSIIFFQLVLVWTVTTIPLINKIFIYRLTSYFIG